MAKHREACDASGLTVKYEGPVMLLICDNPQCAVISAVCEHQTGQWNSDPLLNDLTPTTEWSEDRTVLSCTYCGKDVT